MLDRSLTTPNIVRVNQTQIYRVKSVKEQAYTQTITELQKENRFIRQNGKFSVKL